MSVTYRPEVVSFRELCETASKHACATKVWTTTDEQLAIAREIVGDDAKRLDEPIRVAKDSDQIYYLAGSTYAKLPLTPLQARRVNGALYTKTDPNRWLSPRQLELHARVEKRLEHDPEAFDGLTRPSSIDGLAEYAAQLEARLDDRAAK